ncbi:rod shape-determining protein RodA [Oceanisphaera arctica]|uniref:Rod shape-determining protein RodA n=2 Tax=Oceanisphaera arctica TaxID=641510 RepID=A0A2P5TNN9_9GAMM|nr:rod shape-determining protein RodA [Oceanisphaera arctica]
MMMKKTSLFGAATLLAALSVSATPAPEGARVYFISPADGEQLSADFTVRFGLEGMGVAPAGTEKDGTGHHHLLINAQQMPDLTQPLPASDQVRHFGGGQTEARLSLPPGDYRLQLVLGDAQHVPHQPPVMSDVIQITVK